MPVGWEADAEKGHTLRRSHNGPNKSLRFEFLLTILNHQAKIGEPFGQGCIACSWTLDKQKRCQYASHLNLFYGASNKGRLVRRFRCDFERPT